MCSQETFMKRAELRRSFSEESLAFQKKILEKSGYDPKTCLQITVRRSNELDY